MRCAAVAVLICCGLSSSSAHAVHPLLHWRSRASETGSVAAQVVGSRARAAAAIARARSAESRAVSSDVASQQLKIQTLSKQATLDDLSAQAAAQADKAALASKSIVSVLKKMQDSSPSSMARAKSMAVELTQHMLAGKYQELDAWRKHTLQNPNAEGLEGAGAAAEPYSRMANEMQETMLSYQNRARESAFHARRLADAADATEAQAQSVNLKGDLVEAAQGIQSARALQSQARQYIGDAQSLSAAAEGMNNMASVYIAAGNTAALNAQYESDALAMPPMLADPDVAFTPPPPR